MAVGIRAAGIIMCLEFLARLNGLYTGELLYSELCVSTAI